MSQSGESYNFQCPHCSTKIVVAAEEVGQNIICSSCGRAIFVPRDIVANDQFDELFEGNAEEFLRRARKFSHDESATEHDESAFDTGPIDDLSFSQSYRNDSTDDSLSGSVPSLIDEVVKLDSVVDGGEKVGSSDALHIDGISPDEPVSDDQFYLRCSICNSDLLVSESQIGRKVFCSDCHSKIKVIRPENKKRRDPWRRPAEVRKEESSNELRLADEEERQKPTQYWDPSTGFGSIDPADIPNELLGGELESLGDEVVDAELNLLDINPPAQKWREEDIPMPAIIPDQDPVTEDQNSKPQKNASTIKQPASSLPKPEVTRSNPIKPLSLNRILELELFADIDLITRTVISIMFLTFAYAMSDSVWNTLNKEELNGGEKFVEYLPALLGSLVCFAVAIWYVSITVAVLISTIGNGLKRVEEWIGFSPGEWLGSFFVVACSSWSAALPGALIGYLTWKVTSLFLILPFFTAVSLFVFAPIFLISSFQNESSVNLFSKDILKTIQNPKFDWFDAYIQFGIIFGAFIIGTFVLYIPGIFFCFVGAVIQVLAATALGIMIGFHSSNVNAKLDNA
ncbi:MAG: hypothetical protein AAGA30_02275 [Planctomycetota bacterium]